MNARVGFFQASRDLVHNPNVDTFSKNRTVNILEWFSDHLELPERFSRSNSKGFDRRETKGLSWFKPTAMQHVSKAFELAAVLEENGYGIELLKEKRIGYIVFEDDIQVVAEPFSDTVT